MERRRVVFVNRYFYPDHSATSQLLSDLAFHLADRGWQVTVIASRQRYDDPSARLPRRDRVRGVDVRRAFSTSLGRTTLAGRALDYASFYAGAFIALVTSVRHGDIVVAKTDPPLISVVAAVAARIRGATLVNWVQDLFPEVAVAAGMRFAAITRGARDWSLRRANSNVAISDGMAERIRATGATAVVQHNWADAAIAPVERGANLLRSQYSGSDFIVEYSGNLGRAHDEVTIAAAVEVRPDMDFLFIGGGSGMVELRKRLAGARHARFLDYQPRDALSESLSAGDVHIVTLRPQFESLILPSKIYGILAAGRCIVFLGSPHGDTAALVRSSDCGMVVDNADALAAVLLQLKNDTALRSRLGMNGRASHESRFRADVALSRWEEILTRVNE